MIFIMSCNQSISTIQVSQKIEMDQMFQKCKHYMISTICQSFLATPFDKRLRIVHGKNKLFEHKSLYCQKSFLQVYFTSNPVLFYFFHFGNHPPLVSCNTSFSVLVICSSSSIYSIKPNKNEMTISRILLFDVLPFYRQRITFHNGMNA